MDPVGNVGVTDMGDHRVLMFDPEGKLLIALGTRGKRGNTPEQFNRPTDVAFLPSGEFLVTDSYGNGRVVKLAAPEKTCT